MKLPAELRPESVTAIIDNREQTTLAGVASACPVGGGFAKTKTEALKASWIPDDCRLPDDLAAIERGREPQLRQRELFTPADAMSKLKRIKSGGDR